MLAEAYQTVFGTTPGSAEMPSASRPFTAEMIARLVVRGVTIAPLTLHTGVSSLEGGEEPYPEPFLKAGDGLGDCRLADFQIPCGR